MKEEVLKQYIDYIQLIINFGNGVMLTVHIEEYFQKLNGFSKSKVYKDLRVLESYDLIEFHKLHCNNYVKLKKLAIAFIENKKYTSVSSVSITYRKLKKTIMINELILKHKLKADNVNKIKDYFLKNTTLINKSKVNYEILEKFEKNDVVKYEIKKLKKIRENQLKRLNSEQITTNVKKEFSLNNMQARAIYITKISDEKIKVALLDLNNNYDSRKLINNIKESYRYLRMLTDKEIEFVLILHSENRKSYFLKRKKTIKEKLLNLRIYNQCNLRFINLDISRKLFSNVKFLI